MKKMLFLLLIALLSVSFCACRPVEEDIDPSQGTSAPQAEEPVESGESEEESESPDSLPQEAPISLPAERPEDFAIYFKWGAGDGSFLDTYNGKVGRDMVSEEDITADYTASEELLDEIYAALLQYDIADIRVEMTSENLTKDGTMSVVIPNTTYLICFRANGQEHTVRGDISSDSYEEAKGFHAFNHLMAEKVRAIWQELEFPEPQSAYC